ncbi:MAG: ABC transporter permease [Rhodocyclaceae bacterium]|nr:ABC transporter permease [Rhodocyclaceae bacterium]
MDGAAARLPVSHPRDPAARSRLGWTLAALVLLWPALVMTDFRPLLLLDPRNLEPMGHFLGAFWPPASSPDFLSLLATATLETLAMATAGIALAWLLAVPMALVLTRALSIGRLAGRRSAWWAAALRGVVRGVLLVLRGVPELVWALVFVRVFGLGPAAGVLALGVTYGGMLGKVYSEILESADQRPVRALLEAGSGRLPALAYGLVPSCAQELVSYTVYRWECAIRASVVMGFVGAGGLGQLMDQSMKMLNGSEAATILATFLLLVLGADQLSARLRSALS